MPQFGVEIIFFWCLSSVHARLSNFGALLALEHQSYDRLVKTSIVFDPSQGELKSVHELIHHVIISSNVDAVDNNSLGPGPLHLLDNILGRLDRDKRADQVERGVDTGAAATACNDAQSTKTHRSTTDNRLPSARVLERDTSLASKQDCQQRLMQIGSTKQPPTYRAFDERRPDSFTEPRRIYGFSSPSSPTSKRRLLTT